MAYTHTNAKGDWTLYTRKVELNGGRAQTIYFFSRGSPKSGTPTDMPAGFTVMEAPTTGLPILKRA